MAANDSSAALRLRDVRKSFGPVEIIRGVNLDVRKGERHALIGPNGAGKSTLFHLISGRLPISGGAVHLHGQAIHHLGAADIYRRHLSRSFQITNVFAGLSVIDNLRCAVFWRLGYRQSIWHNGRQQADVEALCHQVAEQIGLAQRCDVKADVLSYAEQRALDLGIAIAGGADVLLLDEPMAGMNRTETRNAVALIRKVSEGKTLLMVEHDMGVIFDLADRISVLVYGRIIATGTPEEIRANPLVQEAYLGSAPLPNTTAQAPAQGQELAL